MIKLKSLIYLNEHFDSSDEISIKDVENLLSNKMGNRDSLSVLNTIYDFYHSEDKNKQVQSIEDQNSVMQDVANRHGLKVVDTLKEEKSGKKRKKPLADHVPALIGLLNPKIYTGIPTRADDLHFNFFQRFLKRDY